MNRTLDQLNSDFDALLARVNAIDGENLPAGSTGAIAQLTALIQGLKKTLGNVNMGYKQDISTLTKQITDLQQAVQNLTGVPH